MMQTVRYQSFESAFRVSLQFLWSLQFADKTQAITIDNDGLRAANNDLKGAYNDKAKAHARVQKQYDGLKKQSLQLDVQSAAVDAVEETLNSIGSRIMDPRQQESHRQHLSPSQGNRYDLRSSGSGSRDETRRVQPIFGHTWVGQGKSSEILPEAQVH